MYFVYLLKSVSCFNKYYYGVSNDLKNCLNSHNNGEVKGTINGMPWKIQYMETFTTKAEALSRQKFLKSDAGWHWLKREGIFEQ